MLPPAAAYFDRYNARLSAAVIHNLNNKKGRVREYIFSERKGGRPLNSITRPATQARSSLITDTGRAYQPTSARARKKLRPHRELVGFGDTRSAYPFSLPPPSSVSISFSFPPCFFPAHCTTRLHVFYSAQRLPAALLRPPHAITRRCTSSSSSTRVYIYKRNPVMHCAFSRDTPLSPRDSLPSAFRSRPRTLDKWAQLRTRADT